jgi:hypothetical protein
MAAIVFFQKNPKASLTTKGILELDADGKIYFQTALGRRIYKSSLVTFDGHVLLADSEEFLKELSQQSKLSQITYMYTTDINKLEEYRSLLTTV